MDSLNWPACSDHADVEALACFLLRSSLQYSEAASRTVSLVRRAAARYGERMVFYARSRLAATRIVGGLAALLILGTSADRHIATHVDPDAAVAALVRAANQRLTPHQVKTIMMNTAVPVHVPGNPHLSPVGSGLVDASAAIARAVA